MEDDETGYESAYSPGEVQILAKLDELMELIEVLTEKVHNLNLVENEGYSNVQI